MATTTVDSFLDSVKAVLIASGTGVAELTSGNVTVWHFGASDPEEDIASGVNKCQGVSVLIYDTGADSDPDDAESPVLLSQVAIELFVDPTKRNRTKTPALRTAGAIRDSIMKLLHLNSTLLNADYHYMEPRIKGYKPLADPSYTVFRIQLQRYIYLG